MPLQIIRNDITLMPVDAIVNAANKRLLGGGGVDGAIHRAAGPQLLAECRGLGGCKTGQAKITGGYLLPCRYVIHTVGPVWHGGLFGEREKLAACYRNSLLLAQKHGLSSVAFPLISAGAYGYPPDKALKTAVDAISAFLLENDGDMEVYLVLFDKTAVAASEKLFAGVQQYIDDHYFEEHFDDCFESQRCFQAAAAWDEEAQADFDMGDTLSMPVPGHFSACAPISLEDALEQIDESFSQMVLRRIKEKGMKNADCYKKANLDKKLFSKINNDIHYKPRKQTALALAIALEMDLDETKELLMKAGLALTHSEKFDIIVEYFIKEKKYDIFEINEVLFYYDQPLLGCVAV